MTSGTKVVDRRGTVTGLTARSCGGTVSFYAPFTDQGFYERKTWDGGDCSTLPAPKRTKVVSYNYATPDSSGKWIRSTRYVRDQPKRKKVLGEHGYSMSYIKRYYEPMQSFTTCPPGSTFSASQGWESNGAWSPALHKLWDSNMELALIGKLRERIQGSDFNAAVALGEGQEALATITEAAQRIRRAGSFLRGGNVKKAARSLLVSPKKRMNNIKRSEVTDNWFADNWLQLQYGWLPLVGDVFGAARHLAYLLNRRVDCTYRSRVFSSGSPKGSGAQLIGGESLIDGRYKAIISHINEVALAGLTDPASLAWEKLPYSFVADWFIPVGSYLEAAGLQRSLTGTFVRSLFTKVYAKTYMYDYTPATPYVVVQPSGTFELKVTLTRTVSGSLNVPFPQFKPLSEALSWRRATSAAALLIKAFPRPGNR